MQRGIALLVDSISPASCRQKLGGDLAQAFLGGVVESGSSLLRGCFGVDIRFD